MKKAFEKIIERAKCTGTIPVMYFSNIKVISIEELKNIVNKVAEEYKSNDGWIPCSDKTPSGEFYYLVSTAKGGRTIARCKGLGKWWDLHNCEVEDEVIAWQELPEPCRPCINQECPYNKMTECPASAGCPGYEEKT